MSIKAVSYCRYSTDNQTENSIMYQMAAAEEYCKKHGMVLIDVYSDEAKTGTNTNREGLQRLIKDCDTSKFDAIIIYDQSRLSRNISDWFELRQLFSSKGKQLYSCNEQLSSDYLNSNAFLSEGIHALFAQNHVIETRRKTLDGVKSKAKQAGFCGGTPPLGYDIVNGEYVINEKEAPAIRKMFEMYALGKSYDDIMQVLYREGYRSKRGNKISSNAIYYLLRNERYVGIYYWNKYQYTVMRKRITRKENPEIVRIENAIPPIIDKETWTMVQEQLSKNKGASTRTKRQYLLSGLIKCGYCGGTYTGFASKNRRSGEETVYYTCSTKERLEALEMQRDDLKIAVLQAELQKHKYTKEQIASWIGQFKYGDVNSREYQKRIIDTFVNSLYLFDDRLVITYNFKGGTETITLKDVEAVYGSDLKAMSPPEKKDTTKVVSFFLCSIR